MTNKEKEILDIIRDNPTIEQSEIADLLNMNQSAISHQLRILKDAKLIKKRRDGKTIYYSLDDDHVYNIIAQGIEHVEEWSLLYKSMVEYIMYIMIRKWWYYGKNNCFSKPKRWCW